MNVTTSSVTFLTRDIAAVRRFYDAYFETWYPFDCGWYVLMRLGRNAEAPEFGFMEPRGDARPYGGGATLNVLVEDVDALYQRMTERGEQMVIPLADNPWGDRGFGVLDPIGLVVYCHKVIPPSAEFRRFIQSAPDAVRGA